MAEVFLWYTVKLFSHQGGDFLVQSKAVVSWGRCFSGVKSICFLMGEVFVWYKMKLFFSGGDVFLVQSEGVVLVQSEAVVSRGRCFSGAK